MKSAAEHRPVLNDRTRKALGKEYEWKEREKLPGEVDPPTREPLPWVPLQDLEWQPLRPGAGDAMGVQSRGLQT